jgi:hypothetical protein
MWHGGCALPYWEWPTRPRLPAPIRVAARTFVSVTGDIRNEMFGYLTAHAPVFFADKQPGVLSSRVSDTVIAIAHRLSTLQTFDRIVVLNRGRVVQDGSPAELAAIRGIYSETLARQRRRSSAPHAA